MYCTTLDIIKRIPVERLKSSRIVLKYILENLGYSRIRISKQDFIVNPLGDDTLKREIEMFKLLSNSFSSSLKGDRVGNAINRFVKEGVTIKRGELEYNNKEIQKLHDSLHKYLGVDIADKTGPSTLDMLEDQYKISKDLVSRVADKVGRNVNTRFNKVDKKTIDIINKDNNFFISGIYDKQLIGRVNNILESHVRAGTPINELAEGIKGEMEKQLPSRADSYYQILANDSLSRARAFGQINSYAEARIRRYEILAVLDERTSEICEYMDGMVFDTEIARKVVKDIQSYGVPESDKQVGEFKALRPWVFFDSEAAQQGKNALYFEDAKGSPIYLPNSGFKESGGIYSLSDKGGTSGTEIQALGDIGLNAPVLPPYHAHCRSTTIISEEEIRTEEWIEEISIDDLGFGSELQNILNGEIGEITGITKEPVPIVTVTTPTEKTKGPIGTIATKFTPTKITKPIEGKAISDFVKPQDIKETITPNKDRLQNEIRFKGPEKLAKEYINVVKEAMAKMPDDLFKPLQRFDIYHKSKMLGRRRGPSISYILGEHVYNPALNYSFINLYDKIPKALVTAERNPLIPLARVKETVHHEVGHGFWKNITDIKIPEKTKTAWRDYHKNVMEKLGREPETPIVSYYSRTNSEEHFCEGLANWYTNKDLFKEKESNAFDFFEEHIIPLLKGKE